MNNEYTKETLLPLNESYDAQHVLNDRDVTMANIYKYAIESSRSRTNRVKCGDIIMIKGKKAHVEKVDYDGIEICENAYVPFISCKFHDSSAEISTSTSGGPWRSITTRDLHDHDGIQELKTFCFFGHCGATANGAVEFKALVNVFEMK